MERANFKSANTATKFQTARLGSIGFELEWRTLSADITTRVAWIHLRRALRNLVGGWVWKHFPRPRRRSSVGNSLRIGFAAADPRRWRSRRPRNDDCRFRPANLGRAERYSPAAARWPDAALDGRGYARALSGSCRLVAFRIRAGIAHDRCCAAGRASVRRYAGTARARTARGKNARRHPRRRFRGGEHGHKSGERISPRSKC